ncbi:FkbM family methyltransferase [Desulfobacterium sp. N47]
MKYELDRLRAYYRFKNHFSPGSAMLPWIRKRLKNYLQKTSIKELVRTESNLLIPVDSAETATSRVQMRGSIDPGMEWIIRRYVKKNTTAVDIGANLGLLSLVMADQAGDDGAVYSIEPNINLHQYIKTLFHLNSLNNINLVSCACSDKEGSARFAIDSSDHTMSMISDSGEYEIKTLPLDIILNGNNKPVSFIKIDVEGHEPSVMIGAKNTILKHKPALVFETGFHPQNDIDGINDILRESRYDVIGVIKNWGIEKMALTANMTKKKHCNVLALPKLQ